MGKISQSLKMTLHVHCLKYIEKCIDNVQQAIDDAMQSGNNETKNSAGDKHETGRALLHLEQEKNSKQLYEAIALKEKLIRIDPYHSSNIISVGSIVFTTNGNFYIAIAAGKLEIDGKVYFTISPSSPIAIKLIGKKPEQCIEVNDRHYEILSVL
ncbi:MAG: 3-oxoacyl-ACP synthase [Bacteroidia bacterium]